MGVYLVVAHQTSHSPELIKALKEKQAESSANEFVLLVPITRYEDLMTEQQGSLRDIARRAAAAAVDAYKASDIHLRWTVISEFTPAVALDVELKDHPSQYAGSGIL